MWTQQVTGELKVQGLGFNDVIADGVVDEFSEGMEVELEHNVRAVGFGGVDADAENRGNFLVGFALGEELKDFAFAGGEAEARAGRVGGGGGVGSGGTGDPGGEVGLALADGVDGGQENAVGVVFQDISAGAGIDNLLNEVVRLVHGEDQDFSGRRGGANTAGGFNTVEKGHTDIEDRNVRLEFGSFVDSVAPVCGFGADLPAGAGFEKGAQASTNHGMIIRDEDAQTGHCPTPWAEGQ